MQKKIIDSKLIKLVLSDSKTHQVEFVKIAKIIYGALLSFHQLDDLDRSDLLQSIFLKLFAKNKRRIKMWNKKAKFSTYLYMIATNQALDYIDSKYFRQKSSNINNENIDSIKNLNSRQESSYIIDKLTINMSRDKLRSIEKQIVKLYYFKDYKEREIASKLKMSINTVSSVKNRAIKKMKKELMQEFKVS